MIEFIHKYPMLIKVILTVTTLAFVFGGYLVTQDATRYAARVEDQKISMEELDRAVTNLESFYRSIYQGNVPEDLFRNMKLGKMALDQLIDRKVILITAGKMDLGVSDDEISDAVRRNQSFQDEQGNFSKAVYVQVLKFNNLTPEQFESSLRNDLAVEKFRKMVEASVMVPEEELRRSFKEQREAQGMEFDEQAYADNRDSLFNRLQAENRAKVYRSIVDNLKSGMDIEIYPDAQAYTAEG